MTKWLVAFAALAGLAACGVGEVPAPPGEAGADAAADAKAAAADEPEPATAQPNAAVTTATR